LRRTLRRRALSPVLGIALVTAILPLMVSLVEFGKKVSILGHPVSAAALALALPALMLLAGSLHTLGRYWHGLAVSYLPAELFNGPVGETSDRDAGTSARPDPLRRAARGSLYLHQHDVKIVLHDIGSLGYDLVVFIDDLDRCTAATAAEMFEAINLFLSGLNSDGLSARFVIGMDSSVIAAHLDQVYSGLNAAQVARRGDDPSIGWTYLRKLVQLPVVVPQLSGDTIAGFIDAASGLPDRGSTPALPVPESTAAVGEPVLTIHAASQQAPSAQAAGTLPRGSAAPKNKTVTQVIPWRTMEQHPLVRELMHERLGSQPDVTVREAKRLINVWQLYSRILARTRPLDSAAAEISRARTMVILAEIIIRWPALQQYLLRRADQQIGLRVLADSAGAEKSWIAAARQLGIAADYHRAALASLRVLLKQYDGHEIALLADQLF